MRRFHIDPLLEFRLSDNRQCPSYILYDNRGQLYALTEKPFRKFAQKYVHTNLRIKNNKISTNNNKQAFKRNVKTFQY